MTIHGSKGLQSKVVVVCGLFSENQSNLGQSLRDSILVSGQLFSPRPKPWKSRDNIDSGSWRLSSEVLTSQVQAEARRLLYVACTRVKDRLILAGAPKGTNLDSKLGEVEIKWKYKPTPRFGWMWLEALRQAAHRDGQLTAPWLLEGDTALSSPLPFCGKGEITLSPSNLMKSPYLAPGLLPNFPIYHHPDVIMPERENISSLVRFTRLQESARLPVVESPKSERPRVVGRKIRIAPHTLDTANSCIRSHWLKEYVGISGESINLPYIPDDSNSSSEPIMPAANELGSLFHRLVELGLPNPGLSGASPSTPLSEQWVTPSPNLMTNPNLISQVLDELLPITVDRDITAAMLMRMAEVLLEGKLGRLTLGESINNLHVEALRTEWPFLINIETELSDVPEYRWTPHGEQVIQQISSLTFEFDGIADLVLCQTDGNSQNTIRAIDLKTIGCLSVLDPPDEVSGTIFEVPSDVDDETDRTDAEIELLSHYRMQLYLYHLCLVRQEAMRGAQGLPVREVQRPAILVAATGRLISWTEEEFEAIAAEFDKLLHSLALVEVEERTDESCFPRLSGSKADACKTCPFYRGNVRLCAPEGIALGAADN
jgi:hypothetical protein